MELLSLIEKCKQNDRKAQFKLYNNRYEPLMKLAYRYYPNKEDAAEIVNLAFFKILTNLDKYNDKYSFEGWTNRILTNTIIDEFRKNKKFKDQLLLDDTIKDVSIDLNFVEFAIEKEQVETILNQLSDEERLVFNLYELEGFSHKEISDQLNVSERTSKRYLSRAKLNLKNIISDVLKHNKIAI